MNDVIVIGGGPAGSSTAATLAQAGLTVLVIEKSEHPRDKICGDGLIADSIHCVTRLGLLEKLQAKAFKASGFTVFEPSQESVSIDSVFYTMRRPEFDHLLAQNAQEKGAKFHYAKVTKIDESRDDQVAVQTDNNETFFARYVVVATGANLGLIRPLSTKKLPDATAVAIRGIVKSEYRMTDAIVTFIPVTKGQSAGYGWVFPLPNGEYNVGAGVSYSKKNRGSQPNLHALLNQFIETNAIASEIIASGHYTTQPIASVLRTGLEGASPRYGRVVVVGETLGSTFPLTGEGVGKAMETGIKAGEALIGAIQTHSTDALVAYETWIKSELPKKYKGYNIAEKWVGRPWMLKAIVKQAQKSVRIRRAIAQLLDEEIDLAHAFRFKNILKLGWSVVAR